MFTELVGFYTLTRLLGCFFDCAGSVNLILKIFHFKGHLLCPFLQDFYICEVSAQGTPQLIYYNHLIMSFLGSLCVEMMLISVCRDNAE